MGNLLLVVVQPANIPDTKAGVLLLDKLRERYPSVLGICGDAGYRGTFVKAAKKMGFLVDISERIKPFFEILPKRWRVERSFAWLNNSRRLSKDFEVSSNSEQAMVAISHFATLLNRFR
jgi:putative transposase